MIVTEVRAIVTGAAQGLGRHFALSLVQEGARVAAGDLNGAGLRTLKAEAEREGHSGQLSVAIVDVASEASVAAFVEQAASELEGLNVLINNAGILRDGLLVSRDDGAVRKLPLLQWSQVVDVDLTGQFLMAREAAARMVASGSRGVIVNISSLARRGNLGQSNYAAAKAGLDACTRTWALELAGHGIRVGGVAPGVIDTPILAGISTSALESLIQSIPLGRLGTPEEVWQTVRYILRCEFFTGRTVEVDGGASFG
ncbi:MAG TPA: SDR family oxidoreductase [Thermoanaerobaculia bacterium]